MNFIQIISNIDFNNSLNKNLIILYICLFLGIIIKYDFQTKGNHIYKKINLINLMLIFDIILEVIHFINISTNLMNIFSFIIVTIILTFFLLCIKYMFNYNINYKTYKSNIYIISETCIYAIFNIIYLIIEITLLNK